MEKELFLKKEITINAPVSKVWDVLTKPELTRKYMFECDAISEWKKGSPLIWQSHQDGRVYVKGKIVDIEPQKLLQFTTFDPNSKLPDIDSNYVTVTYKLASANGKTKLTITDGDFAKVADGEKRYQDSVGGWDATLPKLKETAEKFSTAF